MDFATTFITCITYNIHRNISATLTSMRILISQSHIFQFSSKWVLWTLNIQWPDLGGAGERSFIRNQIILGLAHSTEMEKVGFWIPTKVATISAFGLSDAPGVYFLTESQQVVNLWQVQCPLTLVVNAPLQDIICNWNHIARDSVQRL